MARPLLFDTTALVAAIRDPARLLALRRVALSERGYLSAVTIAELQAGARSAQHSALIEQLAALFARADRLLVPTAAEWSTAGRLIARSIMRQGAMEPRDHYPDVLIVLMAARLSAAIVIDNQNDMRGWIRAGRLDATVAAPRPTRRQTDPPAGKR
jgi:predicted nucleic acid-binding protein